MSLIPFNLKCTWSNLLLVFGGYVVVVRLLRYRGRDRLKKTYTRDSLKSITLIDSFEMQKYLSGQEFPFTVEKALQFALFR
jgi:hypothetical protein